MLALPIISDEQLKAFLEELGDGGPTLKPIEIAAFNYLKATTNTQANIEASCRRQVYAYIVHFPETLFSQIMA